MAEKKPGGEQHEKKYPSGDRSGEGRPARDDHVYPPGGGRNEFGTHGGPHHEGGERQAPSKAEEEK